MKKKIQIKTKSKNYQIIIENGCLKEYLMSEIKTENKTFIIVDSKIAKRIIQIVKKNKQVIIIKVKGSESIKTNKIYWKLINELLENKINRASTLIAIGGGTIGDLSGFIASTILRGIRFILIPSTLLSQVDSSIGGKNGINSKYGKNLIGTFYHPDLVIIDPSLLNSLNLKQIKSGYAEIVKHALINDNNFFQWLKKNYKNLLKLRKDLLVYAITKSIMIKSKYVTIDEKEKSINSNSRAMLNFGHTFGHALEAMNNYKSNLTHGEAISVGMAIAAKISYNLNNIKKNELDDIINHFKKVGLPYYSNKITKDKVFQLIKYDKKNTNNTINLILLKKIGLAYFKRGLDITTIKNLIN